MCEHTKYTKLRTTKFLQAILNTYYLLRITQITNYLLRIIYYFGLLYTNSIRAMTAPSLPRAPILIILV